MWLSLGVSDHSFNMSSRVLGLPFSSQESEVVTVVALQLFLSSHFFLSTQRVPITCHLSFPVLSRLIDSVSEWQRQFRVAGARGSRPVFIIGAVN